MNTLQIKTSSLFEQNYTRSHRIFINRGGTRSSKSYTISQICALWLLTGNIGEETDESGVFSVVRKYLPALRGSTLRDFIEILETWGVMDLVNYNKTNLEFSFNNRLVEFFSVDNETKLRGRKRKHLFIDEATEITSLEFRQLTFRTDGNIYLAFNPSDANHWIRRELEEVRANTILDVKVIKSSFLDNPFLPKSIKDEILMLRDADPSLWAVYGEGEWGQIQGLIFQNWEIIPDFERTEEGFITGHRIGRGLDFGFTNDPTALVDAWNQGGCLVLDELIYSRGLTNQDIAVQLARLSVGNRDEIIADSAEPKSIEEISRMGWNIKPTQKGPDSIINSIDILKRWKIKVTARSVNLIKELQSYKWKVTKDGITINEPVDFNNHLIDAVRYLALIKLAENRRGSYDIEFI